MASTLLETIKNGLGIRKPQSLRLNRDINKDKLGSLVKFSDDELPILLQRHIVEQKDKTRRPSGLPDIIAYLQPEHERAVQLVQDAERAKALIPEIGQAEKILISSIMSPNDLQEADPIYEIENMPDLPESVVNEISEYLRDRFTNEFKLGEKMEHWTREALFRSGASVLLTLPEATLAKLAGTINSKKSGYENLQSYCTQENYKEILNKEIYTKSNLSFGYIDKKNMSISLHKDSSTILEKNKRIYRDELKTGVESLAISGIDPENPITKKSYDQLSASLEAMTATIMTRIEEGDVIKISENPEVLRFGKAVRAYQKNKLGKDFLDLWKESNQKAGIGIVTGIDQEEVLDMTNYLPDNDENKSLPFNIEIPAESVIPVCIPGQVDQKLGYFVLVDSHGHPIRASQYLTSGGGCNISSRIANAYSTMYGQMQTPGGIQSPIAGFFNRPGATLSPSNDAMSNVFNYILDNVLRRKLAGVGLTEVDFDQYESIATCMFYRMLENKQTTLVFVPEQLITYIAFDYRENGCGRSLLENTSFVLSLMATLLVTNMMAQMKNAIAKQEITLTFDEEETNQDQIIEQVRNIAIQKGQINFTYNPTDIANTVNSNNISIKAVKHPNAPGFDIERTFTTDSMPQADTDLLDKLSTWLTTAFGIPHSVFNQLDDAEYSRSVATSNLFFSQLVRSYQKKLCEFITDFVKLNLQFSPTMQEGLYKIINNHIDGKKTDDLTTPVNDGGKDIKGSNIDAKNVLKEVISNITVSLAAPNIAPNKAQYDLVQEFSSILSSVVDNLYPSDVISSEDSEAQNGLTILKAYLRSNMTKNLLQHMGLDVGLDIQDLDDLYINNRESIMQLSRLARNFNQDIILDRTAQTTETTEEGDDSSTDEFGNSSDNTSLFGDNSTADDYGTMDTEDSGTDEQFDETFGENDFGTQGESSETEEPAEPESSNTEFNEMGFDENEFGTKN